MLHRKDLKLTNISIKLNIVTQIVQAVPTIRNEFVFIYFFFQEKRFEFLLFKVLIKHLQ